jgi:hypothetical protein
MEPFLDLLSSTLHAGETFLLVKQMFFATESGQQKEAWKAFFPNVARRYGDAWYANTGVFRMADLDQARPSASARWCEKVLCMVLDDIGTKCKEPTVKPTWIMETSKGNFQWGYIFDRSEQPNKEDVVPLLEQLAHMGYTDKAAARNAVRNFRIPGSVNVKPGKNRFRSVVSHIDVTRTFTLLKLYEEFEFIRVAETISAAPYENEEAVDTVWSWLIKEGYVVSPPNHSGWGSVLCPNRSQHTNGSPEARYLPKERAFVCFHEHCLNLTSADYLEWVGSNGGPKEKTGLSAEETTNTLRQALAFVQPAQVSNLLPVLDFADPKDELFKKFVYLRAGDSFFNLESRSVISRKAFNATYRNLKCKSMHSKKLVEAGTWFDENRESKGGLSAHNVTYAAGDELLYSIHDDTYINSWKDARPSVSPHSSEDLVAPWLKHCRKLIPDGASLNHTLNLMAFKVQRPSVKINHAVLHMGMEGCGKDTMWAPFIWAVCGPKLRNWGLMDNQTLMQTWGYQFLSEILVLNELREVEALDRKSMANKLKPLVAAPPEMVQINTKFNPPYPVPNRMFLIAFSNDPVPISIDPNDRRWFCLQSDAPAMAPEEGAMLWSWFQNGGFEKVAGWLHGRDVIGFMPKAPPPSTSYKKSLIVDSRPTVEGKLMELIRSRVGPYASGIINLSDAAVVDQVALYLTNVPPPSRRQIIKTLNESGWVDKGHLSSASYGEKKRVFVSPENAKLTGVLLLDKIQQMDEACRHFLGSTVR